MADGVTQALQNLTLYPPGQEPKEAIPAPLGTPWTSQAGQLNEQQGRGGEAESASAHVAGAQEALQVCV